MERLGSSAPNHWHLSEEGDLDALVKEGGSITHWASTSLPVLLSAWDNMRALPACEVAPPDFV